MDQLDNEYKKRPIVDDESVMKLVKKLYGFNVKSVKELNGYDDKNSLVICDEDFNNPNVEFVNKDGYVLKIMNSIDSRDIGLVEGQNEMMLYLQQQGVSCSVPVKNLEGNYYSLEILGEGDASKNVIRLLVYCPGDILYSIKPGKELLHDVGRFTADLDEKLGGFSHSSYKTRHFIWMLVAIPKLRDYTFAVKNKEDRLLVEEVIHKFERDVLGNIDCLEMGMIHGDINEQNLIVNSDHTCVRAIIDFGDSQYSCLIFELFIVLCYMILQAKDIEMGRHVIEGYMSIRKLSDFEKKIVKTGVCARLSQSLVMGAYSHLQDPKNDYVLVTAEQGWKILRKLWRMSDDEISRAWGL